MTEEGECIFTDSDNHCLRMVTKDGDCRLYCGTEGVAGSKDGECALFNDPRDLLLDSTGIYVNDRGNHSIRKICFPLPWTRGDTQAVIEHAERHSLFPKDLRRVIRELMMIASKRHLSQPSRLPRDVLFFILNETFWY